MENLKKYKIKKITYIGKQKLIDFKCEPFPYYFANNIFSHNCHNPELWDFNNGEDLDYSFYQKMWEKREWFEVISILGGDLLCQHSRDAQDFVHILKHLFKDKKLFLFTGKTLEFIPKWCYTYFDAIKYGSYVELLKQDGFPASSNQKVIYKGVDY